MTTKPLLSHLAAITATPFIPELHTDDCDDTTCVRCRTLTPSNLYEVDTWLDNAGVFAKQFWEDDSGELVITGLRIGQGEGRIVAKFGNTIVRHYDGSHTVRPTEHPTGELTAAQWNERYPVGTPVTAYPGVRGENPLTTTTRSKAWTLSGHTPVVLVDGHSGGISLTHVDPVPAEQRIAAGLAAEERHQRDPMDAVIAQLACTCRTAVPTEADYPDWAAWLAQQIAKSDATRRNR